MVFFKKFFQNNIMFNIIRWQRLTIQEINLLSIRLCSLPSAVCRDLPIYLPYFTLENMNPGFVYDN